MRVSSVFLRLLAALFALALVAAACGDDDDDGDQGGAETTQDETGSADTAGDEGGTDDTGSDAGTDEPDGDAASGDLPDEFFSEDCQQAYDSFLAANTQLGSAFTGQVGDFEEAKAGIDALADNAPDEIADAFETFATEMGVFFDALADMGMNVDGQPSPEQLGQLMQAAESVDEAALDQASNEISAYFEDVCGA